MTDKPIELIVMILTIGIFSPIALTVFFNQYQEQCSTEILYDLSSAPNTQTDSLFSGDVEAVAELVDSDSTLIGESANTVTVYLAKGGLPTGSFNIEIRLNNDSVVRTTTGDKDITTLPDELTSFESRSFTFTDYTFTSGDRVVVSYSGGDGSNYLTIVSDDSTIPPNENTNSEYQLFTDIGGWETQLNTDMKAIISGNSCTQNDDLGGLMFIIPLVGTILLILLIIPHYRNV